MTHMPQRTAAFDFKTQRRVHCFKVTYTVLKQKKKLKKNKMGKTLWKATSQRK